MSGGRAARAGGGETQCRLAPDRGRGAARGHRDLDAADADAHQRADLEELEAKRAAGCVGIFGLMHNERLDFGRRYAAD